ncbi:uncharacterized protein JCM6883_001644 [Sporobolomyces salmoneus]|uniref:uncharacterized protein n=1 Tax=Sporobolomyces salmoneus TaxID=183962 RepID=UPI00316C87A1
MGYRFNLSIFGLICAVAYLVYHFRSYYLDYLPASVSSRLRYYAPLRTFEDAAEQGFSTSNFDLSANMAGDQRAGLDDQTLTELRRIMERNRVDFDEARRIHMERMFRKAGIGPDGLPIDKKAITSLS